MGRVASGSAGKGMLGGSVDGACAGRLKQSRSKFLLTDESALPHFFRTKVWRGAVRAGRKMIEFDVAG